MVFIWASVRAPRRVEFLKPGCCIVEFEQLEEEEDLIFNFQISIAYEPWFQVLIINDQSVMAYMKMCSG